MANIDSGHNVGPILSLDDEILITFGEVDPSISGYEAPVGSLYVRKSVGATYQKTGALDTNWTLFEAGTSGSHNALSGLQGGQAGEYYHFTQTQHTDLLAHYPNTNNPHQTNVVNLTDTAITSLNNNEALVYDSTSGKWENKLIAVPPPGGGRLIQVEFGNVAGLSGTATLDIYPQPTITDGVEIWTDDITPTNSGSLIRINNSVLAIGSSANTVVVCSIWRTDYNVSPAVSTLVGVTELSSGGQTSAPLSFTFFDSPNTTSQITYSARVGKDSGSSGTWYINSLEGISPSLTTYLESNAYSIEEILVL